MVAINCISILLIADNRHRNRAYPTVDMLNVLYKISTIKETILQIIFQTITLRPSNKKPFQKLPIDLKSIKIFQLYSPKHRLYPRRPHSQVKKALTQRPNQKYLL